MTTYVSTTTVFCDWDVDVDWDGTHIRLMAFSKVPGIKGGVLAGVVLLNPHTVLKMSNAVSKGMNLAFKDLAGKPERKPRGPSNVLKFERPALEGA